MPRPPDTITLAAVSSGRSDLVSSRPTSLLLGEIGAGAQLLDVRAAPSPAASKAVARTVMTLTGSADCTVATTLPA
jgi:hypothetical protein